MLREKRIKQLVEAGFVSYSDNTITLNTSTADSWFEDDTFFVDVLYGVKSTELIYFCLDGSNNDKVELRLAKVIPKLISILMESGNRVSIGIIRTLTQISPEVLPELAPIVENIETEEKEPKVKKK
jgi:hypothetical protein